jgi:hypothetical protein
VSCATFAAPDAQPLMVREKIRCSKSKSTIAHSRVRDKDISRRSLFSPSAADLRGLASPLYGLQKRWRAATRANAICYHQKANDRSPPAAIIRSKPVSLATGCAPPRYGLPGCRASPGQARGQALTQAVVLTAETAEFVAISAGRTARRRLGGLGRSFDALRPLIEQLGGGPVADRMSLP